MNNGIELRETASFNTSGMISNEQDKFASIVNILRGSEEYVLNNEGFIIGSNLEAVTITGYEEWEIMGKHFSIFYSVNDRILNKHLDDLDKATRTGRLHTLGWRVKKRNAAFWAKIKIHPLRDDAGILQGYRMVLGDATHKAMSNYRVKRIRSEYLNLFNNPFIGIFKFRLDDCRVLLFNEKAMEIFRRDSVDQLFFQDLFTDPASFETFMTTVLVEKKITGFDFLIASPHQEDRWGSISCNYFSDGHFIEGVIIDITENKKQVLELQRLNFELDQFIYHASHDLRSPLTSLLGLVNLIEMEPGKNAQLYSSLLKDRINHLDTLLKDLVFITLNGKSERESETIDFDAELPVALTDVQQQFPNVQIYVHKDACVEFYSDPIRFRTILRNLVSNAFKYHNPHATPPYLKITLRCTAEKGFLSFEDNGIGIDEQHVPKIFNMFYRATPKAQGTGLGLYIVKLMVDKLSGKIRVSSCRGKGTSFYLELPNTSPRRSPIVL